MLLSASPEAKRGNKNTLERLLTFLDEKDIIWSSLSEDIIKIKCKSDNEFFRIAMEFQTFLQEINN